MTDSDLNLIFTCKTNCLQTTCIETTGLCIGQQTKCLVHREPSSLRGFDCTRLQLSTMNNLFILSVRSTKYLTFECIVVDWFNNLFSRKYQVYKGQKEHIKMKIVKQFTFRYPWTPTKKSQAGFCFCSEEVSLLSCDFHGEWNRVILVLFLRGFSDIRQSNVCINTIQYNTKHLLIFNNLSLLYLSKYI